MFILSEGMDCRSDFRSPGRCKESSAVLRALVSPRRKQEAAWVWPRSLRSVLLLHFCTFWKCFKVICLHYSFGTKTGNNQPTPLERKGMSRTFLNTHSSKRDHPQFQGTNGCVCSKPAWTAGMRRSQERLQQSEMGGIPFSSWCAHRPWAATPGTQPHPPTGWHQQFKGNKCCSFLPSPKHLRPPHHNEHKYVPFYTHIHTQSGTSTGLWNKACHIKTLLYTTRTTWSYEHNLNLCICLQTRALWTSPWSFSARGEQRQLQHVLWCCCISKPWPGSEREPTQARLELGHPQGPLPTQTTLWFHGPAPAHQGTAHVGFGGCFDGGFHGGQTDQQTLTLLTAVTKQTKEISLEILVKWFLSLLVKKNRWLETISLHLADSSWDWFLQLRDMRVYF